VANKTHRWRLLNSVAAGSLTAFPALMLLMARFLYTVLYYSLLPLILLRLCYRAWRAPAYASRIAERFGFFPEIKGAASTLAARPIWIHAVSVGETLAAVPLVQALRSRYPQISIVITTMTPTGSERVRAIFGDTVTHVYAPYDMPDSIARFLRRMNPVIAIVMETELWPNTIAALHRRGIATIVANARLSEKSARGYGRISALTRPMLNMINCIAAQTQVDAARFVALGAPQRNVRVTGSIKFDITLDDVLEQRALDVRAQWGGNARRVVIGGSTHEGEEAALLDAYKALKIDYTDLLLVLVPRHPERFERVAQLIATAGLNAARRSRDESVSNVTDVVLADTMGEMLPLLGASDIAFIGGSLIERGGHNMLEPAAWGLPVVTGESDFNFVEVSRLLQQSGGLVKVKDTAALTNQLARWLRSDGARSAAGDAARTVVAQNKGALGRLVGLIAALLPKTT
jgi:3-deoxy-D-manno-octulosonic-acid transferase